MFYIMTVLIVAASAFLWRVRGGLFKKYIPANKLWYAVFFGALAWFFRVGTAEYALCAGLACYAGYQAFGWGALYRPAARGRRTQAEFVAISGV